VRSAGEILTEVRFMANIDKDNRFSDERLLAMFNSVQREIQRNIFLALPENDVFTKTKTYTLEAGVYEYSLPNTIYAQNSVNHCLYFPVSGSNRPLKKLTPKEYRKETGYFISNKKIVFNMSQSVVTGGTVVVTYTYKLPSLTSLDEVSDLPTVCEDYLMRGIERLVHYADSSSDVQMSQALTSEERDQINQLFAENFQDVQYIPITDDTYNIW